MKVHIIIILAIAYFPHNCFSQWLNLADKDIIARIDANCTDTFTYKSNLPPTHYRFVDANCAISGKMYLSIEDDVWCEHVVLLGHCINVNFIQPYPNLPSELIGFNFIRNIGRGDVVVLEFRKKNTFRYYHWSRFPANTTIHGTNVTCNQQIQCSMFKKIHKRWIQVQ